MVVLIVYLVIAILVGRCLHHFVSPNNPFTALVAILWPGTLLLLFLNYLMTGKFKV